MFICIIDIEYILYRINKIIINNKFAFLYFIMNNNKVQIVKNTQNKQNEIFVPVAHYELQHEKDECGKTAKRW